MRKFIIFILALLLVGCQLDPPPLPVIQTPSGPITSEGFPIINDNYDLVTIDWDRHNPYHTEYVPDVATTYQYEGYDIHYEPYSVTGEENEYPCVILTESGNMEIFIQACAGEFGVSTDITLQRGCYGLKFRLDSDIDDRRRPHNHTANALVTYHDGTQRELGSKRVYMTTHTDACFVFFVDGVQSVNVTGYYKALYASAGDNSMVNFQNFWILDLPEAYC